MRLAGQLVDLRQRRPHLGHSRFGARNQPRHGGGLALPDAVDQRDGRDVSAHVLASSMCLCMSRNTARSSITRRALKSVRGIECGSDDLDQRAQAEHLLDLVRDLGAEFLHRLRAREGVGGRLHPQHQFVHRRLAADHDAMLAAIVRQFVERGVDLARIDVLAADGEHVVDAPENALRQARIGAPARVGLVGPERKIAGDEPDHRLRGAFEMRVDRRAALLRRARAAYVVGSQTSV